MNKLPTIDDLYREAWQQLHEDRQRFSEIDRESTPVLAFGRWQTSTVVTAGLNPSEIEFRDQKGHALQESMQRFLHWPSDHQLTEERLARARMRAEKYFTHGKAYTRWFDLYTAFLNEIGVSFQTGTACHTDYLSPFATDKGIARCHSEVRSYLPHYGQSVWVRMLMLMPRLQLILGHGGGWKRMPELLGFEQWEALPTEFDHKGGRTQMPRPYLLFGKATRLHSGRTVGVYWWKPNRNGAPLTWLNHEERTRLGAFIRTHTHQQGICVEGDRVILEDGISGLA